MLKKVFNTPLLPEENEALGQCEEFLNYFHKDLSIKLQEFQDLIGVDFHKQIITERAKCGGVDAKLVENARRRDEEKFDLMMKLVQQYTEQQSNIALMSDHHV